MNDDDRPIHLTPAEAACLGALRTGSETKTRIAFAAGLDLRRTQRVLRRLADAGLAAAVRGPGGRTRWAPTLWGSAPGAPMPQPSAPSAAVRFAEGTSIARLLAAVDRPRRERDLAGELGISRQMAHQNIVRLLALGLLRSADPDRPTQLVAPATDRTLLLRIGEERVLSAFPDGAHTTARNLARHLRQPVEAVLAILDTLKAHGLAAEATEGADGRVALTAAGAAHFQRDASARRAEPWTLPVKSDRVQAVLKRLAEAPARTVDIGRELGIERHTMNALIQYLKRRGLARKAGDDLFAPHEITDAGRRVAAELSRRTAEASN